MKNVQEIISLIEAELAEANELYDLAKGKDAQEAHYYLVKVIVLTHLLDGIK